MDVEVAISTENKVVDDILSDLQPICGSQAGAIMGSLVISLVGNEGQQCRLVTSTQSNPCWGTKRSIKVGQVPHFLGVEEEQTVEGVIPPICEALKDCMIRVAGTVKSHKAKSMIKDRISGWCSRA